MLINHVKDARIKICEFKKRDEPRDSYSVILDMGTLVNGCNMVQR